MGYEILEKREVNCYSLQEILRKYSTGKVIDILSIDTEGYDYKILSNNDWSNYKPKVIITESNSEEVYNLLSKTIILYISIHIYIMNVSILFT